MAGDKEFTLLNQSVNLSKIDLSGEHCNHEKFKRSRSYSVREKKPTLKFFSNEERR